MAELYVKPGNRERGWNDPPQFSYGLQARAPGPGRAPLSRRAAGVPPAAPPGAAPDRSPAAAPPLAPGPPPPGPRGLSRWPEGARPAVGESAAGGEVSADAVLSPLRAVLARCRPAVQKHVCDDIGRRLTVLGDAWAQGQLSAPVRRRMGLLAEELQQQHWDAADEIHRSLMVDHVQEVSQWLVGVKRLIAEARCLPVPQEDSAEAVLGQEEL